MAMVVSPLTRSAVASVTSGSLTSTKLDANSSSVPDGTSDVGATHVLTTVPRDDGGSHAAVFNTAVKVVASAK